VAPIWGDCIPKFRKFTVSASHTDALIEVRFGVKQIKDTTAVTSFTPNFTLIGASIVAHVGRKTYLDL